jgi:hypothetical protein
MLGNTSGFATLVEKEASHAHSFVFTQTCPGNKESSNNPERSFVNSSSIIQKFAGFQEEII